MKKEKATRIIKNLLLCYRQYNVAQERRRRESQYLKNGMRPAEGETLTEA